jgi:hypothetical protein
MSNQRLACVAGLLCLWFLLAIPANASCTGSGTTWSCTSGTTVAQINTAYSSASDGAVFTFASGSYSWSSGLQFNLSKGITLICAAGSTCTVSVSGTVFSFPAGNSSKLYRISGFTFPNASDFMIWTCPAGGCAGTITQFRFDHNTVTAAADAHIIVVGENTSRQYVYGVIDHNSFSSSGSIEALYNLGAEDSTTPPVSPQGTINNMFFEDNTITVASMTNAGLGAIDGWGAGSCVVFRNNTVTNALVTTHELGHNGGFLNFEAYNNHVIANSGATGYTNGYRLIHAQGSNEEIFFNNTFTAVSSLSAQALSLTANYIDNECGSYPCIHQPGRDFRTNKLMPVYVWNNQNTANGSKVDGADESAGTYFKPNRDYYNAVSVNAQTSPTSPFNGSVGMGFGSLANRPTSCTTNPNEAGGGVGYFATDQGTQGTLYRCSATNTWTVHYTPYQYPHPLVSGGAPPPPPPAINPPTNVQAVPR